MRKSLFTLLTLSAVISLGLTSCTQNTLTKKFGGTETITLKPNEVVLNVTWKENEMWVCTKDTATGITYFREKSNWGILEGTVILK